MRSRSYLASAILALIGRRPILVTVTEPEEPETCSCGTKYRHSAAYCSQECKATYSIISPLVGRRGKGTRKNRKELNAKRFNAKSFRK